MTDSYDASPAEAEEQLEAPVSLAWSRLLEAVKERGEEDRVWAMRHHYLVNMPPRLRPLAEDALAVGSLSQWTDNNLDPLCEGHCGRPIGSFDYGPVCPGCRSR